MFTGIIEDVGRVRRVDSLDGGKRLHVEASFSDELRPDQSVSIDGTCLTVTESGAEQFSVTAVEETLAKTTLGDFRRGRPVNLERAVRVGDRLDGHLVQGHVDDRGRIRSVQRESDSRLYEIAFEPAYRPFLIPVGSIAVDGISLTVARLEGETFTVSIIPHTYAHTNVPNWEPGRTVNLEFDLIGKYVAGQLRRGSEDAPSTRASTDHSEHRETSRSKGGPRSEEEITLDWLREQGFA